MHSLDRRGEGLAFLEAVLAEEDEGDGDDKTGNDTNHQHDDHHVWTLLFRLQRRIYDTLHTYAIMPVNFIWSCCVRCPHRWLTGHQTNTIIGVRFDFQYEYSEHRQANAVCCQLLTSFPNEKVMCVSVSVVSDLRKETHKKQSAKEGKEDEGNGDEQETGGCYVFAVLQQTVVGLVKVV